MDERILPVRTYGMAQDLARSMLIVQPNVEQRPAVGGPFKAPVVVCDPAIDNSACFGVDKVDRVKLRSFGIDSVSQKPVVGAVLGVVLGKCVSVDEELLFTAALRHAAE